MRTVEFSNDEFYHIYNRGVEKREIFMNLADRLRFAQSVNEFNNLEPVGSLLENSISKNQSKKDDKKKLVTVVCYALNPNHYHLILQQNEDKGIEKFMHRLGTGYTNYFNIKNKHKGHLFQGKFKAIHVGSNEYLLHLSAYVNLNDHIHKFGSRTPKLAITSWEQFITRGQQKKWPIKIAKEIILEQFKNIEEYKNFAEEALIDILKNKENQKELEEFL